MACLPGKPRNNGSWFRYKRAPLYRGMVRQNIVVSHFWGHIYANFKDEFYDQILHLSLYGKMTDFIGKVVGKALG